MTNTWSGCLIITNQRDLSKSTTAELLVFAEESEVTDEAVDAEVDEQQVGGQLVDSEAVGGDRRALLLEHEGTRDDLLLETVKGEDGGAKGARDDHRVGDVVELGQSAGHDLSHVPQPARHCTTVVSKHPQFNLRTTWCS